MVNQDERSYKYESQDEPNTLFDFLHHNRITSLRSGHCCTALFRIFVDVVVLGSKYLKPQETAVVQIIMSSFTRLP